MARLRANPKRELDEATLPDYLTNYIANRKLCDELTKRVAGMKATMMAYLEEHGIENEKGHRSIVVDGVATITRQRSVSTDLDEDAAEEWLVEHELRDQVIHEVTIEEFSEDDFFRVLFERKVPQDVVDGFNVTHEKYSFYVRGEE
jgi:hypothetical protein